MYTLRRRRSTLCLPAAHRQLRRVNVCVNDVRYRLRAADVAQADYVAPAPVPVQQHHCWGTMSHLHRVWADPVRWSNRFQHRYCTKPDDVKHSPDDVDVPAPWQRQLLRKKEEEKEVKHEASKLMLLKIIDTLLPYG